MSAEHLTLHIGALCLIAVIVGVAAIVARPERVYPVGRGASVGGKLGHRA